MPMGRVTDPPLPYARRGALVRSVFADVFVPNFGMGGDVLGEEVDAVGGIEVDDGDAVVAEPVEAAGEVDRFADDDGTDAELADEAAAIPARGERGRHDGVAVG